MTSYDVLADSEPMPRAVDAAPGSPEDRAGVRGRRWWLLAILVIGLALRVYRLSWGLPDFVPPDSLNYYIRPAARLVAAGELVPPTFVHSPLFVYTIGFLDLVWSHTVGESIDLSPRPLRRGIGGMLASSGAGLLGTQGLDSQVTALFMVARWFCVLVAVASIAVLYLFAGRLVGTRAALFAGAAFAISPLHVLESHRVNADGLMILFALLAAHRTVAVLQSRGPGARRGLLAAFVLAGFAGAVRYNGLAIVTLPAWAAVRWPGAAMAERLRMLVFGGLAVALVLAVGLSPAVFDWQRFEQVVGSLVNAGFVSGGNLDLSGEGWVFHRYVYQIVVSLPYAMGWPVYLCALAGFALLATSNRSALAVVVAAIGPFFLVQGSSLAVEHRYYQLLLPFLALTSGVTLAALTTGRRRLGAALACGVLVYTAALTGSHCLRLGLGTQRAVAAFVEERARGAAAAGRTLDVGYPGPADIFFDPVRTQIQNPAVRLRHVPDILQGQVVRGGEPSREELVERLRAWVDEKDIDVVLIPSWQEGIVERSAERRTLNYAHVFELLESGAVGFRQAAHFRDGFLTENLYVWADPLLETYRAIGIIGYRIFVRSVADRPDRLASVEITGSRTSGLRTTSGPLRDQ